MAPVSPRPGPAAPRTRWAAHSVRPGSGSRSVYGIINEVYWPRIDIPQIRDLGFIVADGKGYWEEVKRCGAYEWTPYAGPGIAGVKV